MSALRRRLIPLRTVSGTIGLTLFTAIAVIALLGPLVAPHAPDAPVGAPFAAPGDGAALGTDQLGRDVLSRVLWGGRSVFVLAAAATVAAYSVGLLLGLVAGFSRSVLGGLIMRVVDILLAFPALVLILLLVTAMGSSNLSLVAAVALLQVPGIVRLVRTVTLEQAVRGFVEAAEARGERMASILFREILPNTLGPISADVGLRFTFSVLIIASVNFLGLGLSPPAADWGLMVSENRQGIGINPWTVLVPATLIGLLTISLNTIADAIARGYGRSQ